MLLIINIVWATQIDIINKIKKKYGPKYLDWSFKNFKKKRQFNILKNIQSTENWQ